MLLELLSVPFVAGGFCNDEDAWVNLIIGLDPDMFVGKARFKDSAGGFVEKLRSTGWNETQLLVVRRCQNLIQQGCSA